ncbi:MAG: energy-coupling factor ABC transporter ATP-binding protein [Pyrinomonadaceae bacterium]
MSDNVFEVRSVTFSYNEIKAIDDLSLTVKKGQRIVILGANGSGKSTLLRLLDGLYFPQRGTISAFGELLTETALQEGQYSDKFRQRVALVFQNPDVQLFNPTVFDEIAFAPLQLQWEKNEIRRRIAEIMEMMEIAHLKDRSPHLLSGGEKKRVAIASVLVFDPQVLLMDEPTAALDPKSRSQIIDLLIGWQKTGKTVITATHDLDIIEDIADYCFIFQAGRVRAEGTPQEMLRNTEILRETNLIHLNRHLHSDGKIHSHPHIHRNHDHKEEK